MWLCTSPWPSQIITFLPGKVGKQALYGLGSGAVLGDKAKLSSSGAAWVGEGVTPASRVPGLPWPLGNAALSGICSVSTDTGGHPPYLLSPQQGWQNTKTCEVNPVYPKNNCLWKEYLLSKSYPFSPSKSFPFQTGAATESHEIKFLLNWTGFVRAAGGWQQRFSHGVRGGKQWVGMGKAVYVTSKTRKTSD